MIVPRRWAAHLPGDTPGDLHPGVGPACDRRPRRARVRPEREEAVIVELELWCGGCATVTLFVVPECAEHADDCPERCCTECGAAILLASLLEPRPAPRHARTAA